MRLIFILASLILTLQSALAFVVESNVEYDVIQDYKLSMDVYSPSKPSFHLRPALVYIHGGCFNAGSKKDISAEVKSLADDGFTIFSLDYRLSTVAKYPAAVSDVQQAIRFIRKHALRFQIDPEKIVTHGESAGGYLAAVLGVRPLPNRSGEIDQYSDRVKLVSDWYGRTDFTLPQTTGTDCAASFLGLPRDPENLNAFQEASINPYVDKNSSAFHIVHGSADEQVYPVHSVTLANSLWNLNRSAELVLSEGASHGFIGGTAWKLTRNYILNFFEIKNSLPPQMHSGFKTRSINSGFGYDVQVERFTKDLFADGGINLSYPNTPTKNTKVPDLYLDVRTGESFKYIFPNPSGVYRLGLFFAEKDPEMRDRSFEVSLFQVPILPGFNVEKLVGRNYVLRRYLTLISNPKSALKFKGKDAMISALEIEEVAY
jgi:acetyl esterase/lipase